MDNTQGTIQKTKYKETLLGGYEKDIDAFKTDLFLRDDYAQTKLDHIEGLFQTEDGRMDFSLAKYENKIGRFQALTAKGNKELSQYSKAHDNKSAKRRAEHAKEAEKFYSNARDYANQLNENRKALDKFNAEHQDNNDQATLDERKKLQKSIYNTEDQLLDERYEAMKESIKTDSVSKNDQKVRLAKAELAYYASKLKALKNRGQEFTNKYQTLYAEYVEKFKTVNDKLFLNKTAHDVRTAEEELQFNCYNLFKESGDSKVIALARRYAATIPDSSFKTNLQFLLRDAKKYMDKDCILNAIRQAFLENYSTANAMQGIKDTLSSINVTNDDSPEAFFQSDEQVSYDELVKQAEDIASQMSECKTEAEKDPLKAKIIDLQKPLEKCNNAYKLAIDYVTQSKINFEPGKYEAFQTSKKDDFRRYKYKVGSMNCPMQGWKLHIPVENWKDYYELTNVLVPEFLEKNIIFKIVNPEYIVDRECKKVNRGQKAVQEAGWGQIREDNGNSDGKEITIYPDKNFNFEELSDRAKALLSRNKNRPSHFDKNFEGNRFTTRYGVYGEAKILNLDKNKPVVQNKKGEKPPVLRIDDRKNLAARPDYVEDLKKDTGFQHVCDVHKEIELRFNRLKDAKQGSGLTIEDYRLYINRIMTGLLIPEGHPEQLPLHITEVKVPGEWHKSYENFKKMADVRSDHSDNVYQNICHMYEIDGKTFLVHTELPKKLSSRLSKYKKYIGDGA